MRARGHPLLLLALSLALGCDDPRMPPPLPVAPPPLPSAQVATPDPSAVVATHDSARRPKGAHPRKAAERLPAEGSPRAKSERAPTPPIVGPAPVQGPSPTPVAPPVPAPTRVVIPSTPHVRAEIPGALQADLDADPRMQPFLERVIAIADDCHARDRDARGTLKALVTMHANARPDADLRGVPPSLMRVVACATGALLRLKMPLFTGPEGARYTVRLHFE